MNASPPSSGHPNIRPTPVIRMANIGECEYEPGFLELWYKKESFTIVPDNKDLPVEFEHILSIPSS